MKLLSRVVWSEGMYLGPHHFQAQSRYFEDSIQFAASSLWFAGFGLAGVELDADALQNGSVALLHARGIFEDGLAFNLPESDPAPEARQIADFFPPTRDYVDVLLAVPPRKPNGYNCALEAPDASARFIAESKTIHDETTGLDERPVKLGRKNLRLVFDTESQEGLLTLPLARVVRGNAGNFLYDADFVPPALQLSASPKLMTVLQRLVETLDERGASLARNASGSREFATREIASFWLLHSINSALAPLRHLLVSKRGHPEEAFVEMSRLAGALCTFALNAHPRSLPLYDHRNLSACFDELDRQIRERLDIVIPTNCLTIPLTPSGDCFWDGEMADERVLGRSRWLLAVSAGGVGEAEIMTRGPQLIKLCSPPFVRELVKRALPGLSLTHTPTPPPAVAARAGAVYFGISRGGPCWDHMVQTRRVGLYVPSEIPNPEVEILVVLDS